MRSPMRTRTRQAWKTYSQLDIPGQQLVPKLYTEAQGSRRHSHHHNANVASKRRISMRRNFLHDGNCSQSPRASSATSTAPVATTSVSNASATGPGNFAADIAASKPATAELGDNEGSGTAAAGGGTSSENLTIHLAMQRAQESTSFSFGTTWVKRNSSTRSRM